MKIFKPDTDVFEQDYLSSLQAQFLLADPTFMFGEVGRGSGKTTKILASRLDRVANAMPASLLVLAASTYRAIFDNILPGLLDFFNARYLRGMYFEVGKTPPRHFTPCCTYVSSYNHSISFCNGAVVQFVSCDRPESMLGKNAAHLFVDELIKIPEDKFVERIIPALRADRSKFGLSHYFMGITGFSSTPNFETDHDWWVKYEADHNAELMSCVQEMAMELHRRMYQLQLAQKEYNTAEVKRLTAFVNRWEQRINDLRRGQTFYVRASSFSNVKILGVDYIEYQVKKTKNPVKLNTSIFGIRRRKVKNMFFGRFGVQHLFDDSYRYTQIDAITADGEVERSSRQLKWCDPDKPLYAGFDPGPFMSIVLAQKWPQKHYVSELRAIKNLYAIHPQQHQELAIQINDFFKYHRRKEIFLYYDRAANQCDPRYRKFYPLPTATAETDAKLLQNALRQLKWRVTLLSVGQATIPYASHYALLNILFSKPDGKRDKMLICRNECEELVSSINCSPLKKTDGKVELDKSSEAKLDYEEQAFWSTQIASAYLYLLWGEYHKYLPSNHKGIPDISPDAFG
jgi:hypothetical protein